MSLRWSRPAVPLTQPQLRGGHVDQPGDVGDGLIGKLGSARREPAVQRIEAQQEPEPKFVVPRRPDS